MPAFHSVCLRLVFARYVKSPPNRGGRFGFQLYMMRDRGFMADLLAIARVNGCSVLVFTVDLPVAGVR